MLQILYPALSPVRLQARQMDDCTVVRAASLYLIKRDKDADIHYLIIVGRQQWLLPCLLKRSVLWPAENPMNKALHSLPDKRRAVVQVRWPGCMPGYVSESRVKVMSRLFGFYGLLPATIV